MRTCCWEDFTLSEGTASYLSETLPLDLDSC
ncbi:hypothetical protein [Enhygromyxa salina]|nr:hypothetical protein [Enhygromyxa salina]